MRESIEQWGSAIESKRSPDSAPAYPHGPPADPTAAAAPHRPGGLPPRPAVLPTAARWGWAATAAIALTFAAGALHLVISPRHYDHAKAHGIFFALLGAAQIVLAVVLARRPTRILMTATLLLSGLSITLYAIVTNVNAPFHDAPEDLEFFAVATKVLEALALAASAAYLIERRGARSALWAAGLVAGLVVASAALGAATYGAAKAMEPVFPGLAEPGDPEEGHSHAHTASRDPETSAAAPHGHPEHT